MIKLNFIPPQTIKDKALWFQDFRTKCKAYLAEKNLDYDKFTIVAHDSYIGHISEWIISEYLKKEFGTIFKSLQTWEDSFDLARVEKIISQNSDDENDKLYVKKYFYDEWDICISTEKGTYKCDIKTALTKKEPQANWNFFYPIVQAEKKGKDLMILIYYIYEGESYYNLKDEVLIGAITYDLIRKCKIIKKGEISRFGTTSQTDNYITELSSDYHDLSDFLK